MRVTGEGRWYNSYSSAFDSQKPITVKCKPQYADGELDRLYISDVAA
jgi:hypothetical protein